MKRGGCTYGQKAEMVKIAGGHLGIVHLLEQGQDPDDIIAIAEKACET
jgi:hypothetical protein